MGTIAQKLAKLLETKADIKAAIAEKGQIPGDVFADYPDKIREIQTGVDTSDATATASDIVRSKTAYVNGQKITGTITEYPTGNAVGSSTGGEIYLTEQGSTQLVALESPLTVDMVGRKGKKAVAYCPSSSLGDATSSDVLSGKTFSSSNGIKITGTLTTPSTQYITMSNSRPSDVISVYFENTIIDALGSTIQSYEIHKNALITFVTNFDSNRTPTSNTISLVRSFIDDINGYKIEIYATNSGTQYIYW